MEGRGNLGNGEGRGREEKGSCWSEHCCGSGKKQIALLREQTLLRQWRNTDSAPAGADTTAAVGKYRKGSCGSGHCCGSEEKQLGGLCGREGKGGGGGGGGGLRRGEVAMGFRRCI